MRSAFSLVELSIVLVILGLLTGGILAGQSLIRASELRAVSTEYNRYVTASTAFDEKYSGLPGDLKNAESYWGQVHLTDATCRDTAGTGTQTCNGDGNGQISLIATRSREIYRFWQHLANAGMIEGSYTGINSTGGAWGSVSGSNVPKSKLGNAGWSIISRTDKLTGGGWYNNIFAPQGQNYMEFGIASTNGLNGSPALKAEEAWNIDTKMDDGRPGTGMVTTFDTSDCASTTTASTAAYVLSSAVLGCVMFFGF